MAVDRRFGPYGGRYVPETLIPALDELELAWEEAYAGAKQEKFTDVPLVHRVKQIELPRREVTKREWELAKDKVAQYTEEGKPTLVYWHGEVVKRYEQQQAGTTASGGEMADAGVMSQKPGATGKLVRKPPQRQVDPSIHHAGEKVGRLGFAADQMNVLDPELRQPRDQLPPVFRRPVFGG